MSQQSTRRMYMDSPQPNEKAHLYAKVVSEKIPALKEILTDEAIIQGLYKLKEFSKGNNFLIEMTMKLEDPRYGEFLKQDLQYMSEITKEQEKEIKGRINRSINNMDSFMSDDDRQYHRFRTLHTPETYFKFGRAFHFEREGVTPNKASQELLEKGVPKEEMKELAKLSQLSTSYMTPEEIEKVKELRLQISPPQEISRVITEIDRANYESGKYKGMVGFYADSANVHSSHGVLTFSTLRLDYENSEHVFQPMEEPFVITAELGDYQPKIPFEPQVRYQENGRLTDNLPYNPFTGNGFAASVNGELTPEYKATIDHPIPHEKLRFGKLDRNFEVKDLPLKEAQFQKVPDYRETDKEKRFKVKTKLEEQGFNMEKAPTPEL